MAIRAFAISAVLLCEALLTGGVVAQEVVGEVTYVQGITSAQRSGQETRFLAQGDNDEDQDNLVNAVTVQLLRVFPDTTDFRDTCEGPRRYLGPNAEDEFEEVGQALEFDASYFGALHP